VTTIDRCSFQPGNIVFLQRLVTKGRLLRRMGPRGDVVSVDVFQREFVVLFQTDASGGRRA